MLRIIGGGLVIAATSGAGFTYGMWLQEYLEILLYLRHVIYLLKGELKYTNAPLNEVFGRASHRVKEPYRGWFQVMAHQVETREGKGFFKIWIQSVDRCLGDLHLKKEHVMLLKELGACLGQMDSESESRNFQLYLERMELEIEKERTGLAAKRRIGNCLGVMSGIFLVIILL